MFRQASLILGLLLLINVVSSQWENLNNAKEYNMEDDDYSFVQLGGPAGFGGPGGFRGLSDNFEGFGGPSDSGGEGGWDPSSFGKKRKWKNEKKRWQKSFQNKFIPLPPSRKDDHYLLKFPPRIIEFVFGPTPLYSPNIPSQPSDFQYPRTYNFCSRNWWIPFCKCFHTWIRVCWPYSVLPLCWYWYGCWA